MGDDVNLFGQPAPPRKTHPRAPAPSVVQQVIDVYVQVYTAKLGERPLILKKDGGLLKRLVMTYGARTVIDRLHVYMAWDDPYVRARGYSLAILFSKWQEVAMRAQRRQSSICPHTPPCATYSICTATILAAGRREREP